MANAFTPHDDCPIPSVEAITGSLVSSCEIHAPIDPIFEFPLDFPLPTPTDFDFGCVEWPSLKTTLNSDATTASLAVHITYPDPEKGNCAPSIEMELSTAACGKPAQLGEINYVLPKDAGAEVERTTEPCVLDWQYNFDFWQRCPRFEITGSVRLMNPWSSHSASFVGGQSASWWTHNTPSIHWDWSSSNAPSIDVCQFYASMDFYWPLVQSSFIGTSIMNEETAVDVCLVEMVHDFTSFAYNSETQVLTLEYETVPAFKAPMVASSIPCIGAHCVTNPCAYGPRGTANALIAYDLTAEKWWGGCGQTQLAQWLEQVDFGIGWPTGWVQEIVYDADRFPWGGPTPNPIIPECCHSYTLLTSNAADIDWVTGCSGSASIQYQSWVLKNDDWTIPNHFVKTGMADYGEPLQSIHVEPKDACLCAIEATVDWADTYAMHPYLYDFPLNGATSSMSLLSSWSCSSETAVHCWFTELSFDHGLLVAHTNYEGDCRPAEMVGYCP